MSYDKLGLWVLTALVVGNMVGSGIFMLPSSLASVASPGGVLLAWLLTGAGVLMLALVFGNLAVRKPELSGGPQMYAKALFKPGSELSTMSGYLVAWGYWVANGSGNVAIITTFTSYLSTFFPILTSSAQLWTIGDVTITVGSFFSFAVCSILLWALHFIILRGIEGAGKINLIATAAKAFGFTFFIIISLFAFQSSNLVPIVEPKIIDGETYSLLGQINKAAIATLWAFVGVEAAVVFSSRAARNRDVKTATLLGLTTALVIYIGITLLVMGALPQQMLIQSEKPLVDALSSVVGQSGTYIMAALGLVSMLGASIGWILASAEVPFQAAKQRIFLSSFLKENKNGAPVFALIATNMMSQLFIFSTLSQSITKAFDFVITIATLSYLLPYIIAAIYQLKLVISGETYALDGRSRVVDGTIAILASLYSLWIIKAGTDEIKIFILGIIMILIGLVFYPQVKKHQQRNPQ